MVHNLKILLPIQFNPILKEQIDFKDFLHFHQNSLLIIPGGASDLLEEEFCLFFSFLPRETQLFRS